MIYSTPISPTSYFGDLQINYLSRHARTDETSRNPRRARPRRRHAAKAKASPDPPETGKFLALILVNTLAGDIIEVGTSAGYSTLWLTLAAESPVGHVTTFEVLPEKVTLARDTFRLAGVEHAVELIADGARRHIEKFFQIAFCFLDAEKEIYEMMIPRLVKGGLLVADNAINHREALQSMLERVDSLTDD